jgi:hypothetical protein
MRSCELCRFRDWQRPNFPPQSGWRSPHVDDEGFEDVPQGCHVFNDQVWLQHCEKFELKTLRK